MKPSCERSATRSIKALMLLTLVASPLAHAATGDGQAYGLNATINVNNASPAVIVTGNLPNPQADTAAHNPDTETVASALLNAPPLSSPVLSTGILSGTASASLTGFNTDGVSASGGTDGTVLDIGVASLVDVVKIDTGVLSASATGACVSGAPTFAGSSNITNLKVWVLGAPASLNLSTVPNNTVLSTNTNLLGIVTGNLSIISNEQTPTANGLSVNGLHVSLTASITIGLVTVPVTVNMTVGHANVSLQSNCAVLPTLALGANPTPFVRGSNATYTATVTNNSGITLIHPLVVTETLSSGLTLVPGSASAGWSCAQSVQTVTCTSLSDASAATTAVAFDVSVAANTASSVINNATFGATNDPAPANCAGNPAGCATLTTAVITAAPNLSVALSASPDPFTQGGSGTYTAVITNSGNAVATAPLTFTDILPADVSYVSSTGSDAGWNCSAAAQTVSCTTPNALAYNAGSNTTSVKLNVTIAAAAASPVVDIAGSGSGNSLAPDCSQFPLPSGCASLSTAVTSASAGSPSLAVSLSASPTPFVRGATGGLIATITNTGNAAATAPITTTFALPTGLSYLSGGGNGFSCSAAGQIVSCTSPTGLATSASTAVNITVQVAANAPASMTTIVSAGSGNAPAPANCASVPNQAGCAALTTAAVDAPSGPDLVVTISPTGPFIAGGTSGYLITVTNIGGGTALGPIGVYDTLPTGLTYLSSTGAGWACSAAGQLVTCSNPSDLAPGAQISVVLTVQIAINPPTTVIDVVSVGSTNDPAPQNCAANPAQAGCASVVTVIAPAQAVFMLNMSAQDVFVRGTLATYQLSASNIGGAPSSGALTVIDILPDGLSFHPESSEEPAAWNCSAQHQVVTCTSGAVLGPAGTSPLLSFSVAVASDAPDSVANSAVAGDAVQLASSCTSAQLCAALLVTPVVDAVSAPAPADPTIFPAPATSPIALLLLILCITVLAYAAVRVRAP